MPLPSYARSPPKGQFQEPAQSVPHAPDELQRHGDVRRELVARNKTLPKSVCACERQAWHLSLLHRVTGEELRVRFRCKSWRHAGECARGVAAEDEDRIKRALDWRPLDELLFLVVTLDQKKERALQVEEREQKLREGHAGPLTEERMMAAAYQRLCRKVQSLVQWLRRSFGEVGYCMTVESHKTGWPHANLIIHSAAFATATRRSERLDSRAPEWLREALVRCGLGPVAWVETPRNRGRLAHYLVKLAHCGSLAGEVTKLSQLPLNSPPGTRRLRSSKGFLPPRRKPSGEWTGELVFAPLPKSPQAELLGALVRLSQAAGPGRLDSFGTSHSLRTPLQSENDLRLALVVDFDRRIWPQNDERPPDRPPGTPVFRPRLV